MVYQHVWQQSANGVFRSGSIVEILVVIPVPEPSLQELLSEGFERVTQWQLAGRADTHGFA
ncbi:MAG: hypothetical protein R3E84_20450 [Pseudomonadales bacterium]